MAITKTRNMLIDVARQLFATLGVGNTTMNDIAVASHKGRRTLYTYFNNKNEVYKAVVETELDNMVKALQDVAAKDLPADEKLMLFFYTRLDALQKGVDEGSLSMPDVDFTAEILHNALRGLEVPYIRGLINPIDSDNKRRYLNISHLIFEGIKKKKD